jgi:hypothetical protein
MRLPSLLAAVILLAACAAPRLAAQQESPPGPLADVRAHPEAGVWQGSQTVFQYVVRTPGADGKGRPRTNHAYLWVPPAATRINGVLIGGSVLFEGMLASDLAVRQACVEAGLAIVLFTPTLDAMFDAGRSAAPLEKSLADLAALSNHPELATAPLIPFGHSVATIWTRNVLFWKPDRCLAGIFFKGGFGIPEGRALAEIAGIPLLHIQGRFEEFGPGPNGVLRPDQGEDRSTGGRTAMAQLAAHRAAEPRFLMGLLVEDGSTHYPLNPTVARAIAGFLVDATRLRLDGAGGLRAVDPADGALTPAGDLFAATQDPAAGTFWHPSAAQARYVDGLHAAARSKAPQFVTFSDARGGLHDASHDMRLKLQPTFVGPDLFQVTGAFRTAPGKLYPPVDGPVGHAPGPVAFRVFGGPVEQVAPDRFRVTMDERLGGRTFVLAHHAGDAAYRWAEQPANVQVSIALTKGEPQTITWEPVAAVAASALPLTLTATSTSGLPVRFLVDAGPGRIVDGQLVLADVPANAAWPLTIEVIATQYGSAVPPLVASAVSVRQQISISR